MINPKKEILKGVIWQASGRYSALIIQFVVTIIISRILSPEDFGIIGILTVFSTLAGVFLDSGLGQSLIQKRDPTEVDYSTVFFFNLIISIIIYLSLYFSLPYIALFFHDHRLENYGKVLFMIIPLNSLMIVQNTMLQKELKFKYLSIIQLVSAIISGFIGVVLAIKGFGIWSLIMHSIALNLSKTILLLIFNKWMPQFVFSIKSMRELLPFGLNLLMTSLVRVLFNNIYTLIIGRSYTSQEVGYYNQANRFQDLAGNTIVENIIGVSFPIFVKLRDDKNKLRAEYKNIIQVTVSIIVPLMFIIISVGQELFKFLLTEKWLPAVPYLQILSIYGMTLPLHLININILKVYGEGKKIFRLELIRRVILIFAILITIRIGIKALLIGQTVAMLPMILISMYISGSRIDYKVIDQVTDTIRFYIIGTITFIFLNYILGNINTNISDLTSIIIKTLSFLLIYVLILHFTYKEFSRKISHYLKIKKNERK